MANNVLCEVNTCRHWTEGNKCGATEIYIVKHTNKAEKSAETDCKTFELK